MAASRFRGRLQVPRGKDVSVHFGRSVLMLVCQGAGPGGGDLAVAADRKTLRTREVAMPEEEEAAAGGRGRRRRKVGGRVLKVFEVRVNDGDKRKRSGGKRIFAELVSIGGKRELVYLREEEEEGEETLSFVRTGVTLESAPGCLHLLAAVDETRAVVAKEGERELFWGTLWFR